MEVCIGGQWGTVCDNDNSLSEMAAQVVCRQLGYNGKITKNRYFISCHLIYNCYFFVYEGGQLGLFVSKSVHLEF